MEEALMLDAVKLAPGKVFERFVELYGEGRGVSEISCSGMSRGRFRIREPMQSEALAPLVIGSALDRSTLVIWKYGDFYKEQQPLLEIVARYGYYEIPHGYFVEFNMRTPYNRGTSLDDAYYKQMMMVIDEMMKERRLFKDIPISLERQLASSSQH